VESDQLLTLDELTQRVGMSVCNIRFYTSRGLLPPPVRKGRSGYYGPDHVARLELVRELQSHGFTLSAIERYVSRLPADASPEDIALQRTLLAPWSADDPAELSRAELDRRAGRELSEEDLTMLEAMGVAVPVGAGRFQVSLTHLGVGLGLIDLGYPVEAAVAAGEIFAAHGRQIAEELRELFRTQVWPAYHDSGLSPERIQDIVEKVKPLSILSLVAAYEAALDEAKRDRIARRAR
jgi:DNA-binding transcriptional MerR regulator